MVEVTVITKIMYEILIVVGCFCSWMGAAVGGAVEVRYSTEIGQQMQERHMDITKSQHTSLAS